MTVDEHQGRVRLSKVMSMRNLCSRREADELIAKKLVKVDGQIVAELGIRVDPDCKIEILSAGKSQLERKVTIILNKPIGYVSSQAEDGYEPAVVLITKENQYVKNPKPFHFQHLDGLATAGRLDIDSQGLLIFTQDGVMAKKLIGENSSIEKEYLVRVSGHLSDRDMARLRDGELVLDSRRLRKAHVEWINDDQLRFVLKEGMKRQIRRMCEAVGLRVLGLKRVRVGQVMLGHLPEGQWRYLEAHEDF